MMEQIKIYKSSLDNKGLPKAQDTTTMLPSKKKAPPSEVGHYTRNGDTWNP